MCELDVKWWIALHAWWKLSTAIRKEVGLLALYDGRWAWLFQPVCRAIHCWKKKRRLPTLINIDSGRLSSIHPHTDSGARALKEMDEKLAREKSKARSVHQNRKCLKFMLWAEIESCIFPSTYFASLPAQLCLRRYASLQVIVVLVVRIVVYQSLRTVWQTTTYSVFGTSFSQGHRIKPSKRS